MGLALWLLIGFGYANYYATKNYNASQTHLAWTVIIVIIIAPLETSFYLHKLLIAPLETPFYLHKLLIAPLETSFYLHKLLIATLKTSFYLHNFLIAPLETAFYLHKLFAQLLCV